MENHPSLNFLLTEGESGWYARCLEYDFVTQAATLVALIYEIQRTLIGRLMIGAQQGIDPFFGLRRADDRYWEMFRKSSTSIKTEKIVLEVRQHGAPQMPAPELRELRIAEEIPA
jgi:hypothetical protein